MAPLSYSPPVMYAGPAQVARARRQLVDGIKSIAGPLNLIRLYIPDPTEGTAVKDAAKPTVIWTHNAAPAGSRYARQGNGWLLSFDGSSQYLTTPDANDLSFGNGTVDSAFSCFAVANVTDTAAVRTILSKWDASKNEWMFRVTAADLLELTTGDQSVPQSTIRDSDAAPSQGSLRTFAATYNSTGGATNHNGTVLYQDGAVVASTATNSASYVAMEDLTALGAIGAQANPANFFSGSMGLVLLCAGALTAAQVASLHAACRTFFGI